MVLEYKYEKLKLENVEKKKKNPPRCVCRIVMELLSDANEAVGCEIVYYLPQSSR